MATSSSQDDQFQTAAKTGLLHRSSGAAAGTASPGDEADRFSRQMIKLFEFHIATS
jgi:hypothetical protein